MDSSVSSKIGEVADRIIGKPFKLWGRGPEEYDCWGVCVEIFDALGVMVPNGADMKENYSISGIIQSVRALLSSQPPDSRRPGDLLFMEHVPCSPALHVVVVEDKRWIVEADFSHGVRRSRLDKYNEWNPVVFRPACLP